MKAIMQNAFGSTTEAAKHVFATACIGIHEMAVQAHAKIICLFDKRPGMFF